MWVLGSDGGVVFLFCWFIPYLYNCTCDRETTKVLRLSVLQGCYRDITFYTTNLYYNHAIFARDPYLDYIRNNLRKKS